MSNMMTVKEAAEYLKLNYMTIYKLVQKGKIPASKVGGNWRFRKDILDQWFADRSRTVEKKVLIVDDDIRIGETLKDIIQEHGFKVTTAITGEEAIEQLSKRHFDVIFLDLVLPKLTGVDVLRSIKEKDKKAVVIIITGYGDDPIALQAMSLGPLLLIRKPFQIKDVLEILNIVTKVR